MLTSSPTERHSANHCKACFARQLPKRLKHLARLCLVIIGLPLCSAFAPSYCVQQSKQPDKHDCETAKAKLKGLLDIIDILQTEVRSLQASLDELDRKTQEFSEFRQTLFGKFGFAVDDLLGITDSEKTVRDLKAAREKLRKEIIDDEDILRKLNQEIRDVVNKLGTCDSSTDDVTKQFEDCLQKQGAERNLADPQHAHNPKTGQNFVWDKDKKSWIDTKTGECVCPKCPATTTPPTTSPSPKSSPTPNPTPTPTPSSTNNQVGYHVETNSANGLFITTFDTPQGKIKVNLPGDMAAGDTITGTVETEPKGNNDAERAQNQSELNGEVIEVGGQKTKVGDKKISCVLPTTLTSDAKTIVLRRNNQRVASSEVPILPTPPSTPTQFTIPTGGQQGRPIQIQGPCNGTSAPQDSVTIGGTLAPVLAESPRQIIVQNTSNTVGPTNIVCNENGAHLECPFRDIGIKLSAPKLNLLRGETTTLHVVVMGLSGIKENVPLDLNVTGVVQMSGGNDQHIDIPSTQVQADGTYSRDFTLTGTKGGSFGVTGTVRWSDVCIRSAVIK